MRVLLVLLLYWPMLAQADIFWAPETASRGGRGLQKLKLQGMEKDTTYTASLVHSDLVFAPLSLSVQQVVVKPSGKNNYHALVARSQNPQHRQVALRYLYFNGKPVATSPQDLLAQPLAELEITPDPLPREHWRYESRKTYRFKLTFRGQVQGDHPVLVTTGFGTSKVMHTDSSGLLTLTIPEDFPEIIPMRRATPPGELRLFSTLSAQGVEYETSLSAAYHASAKNWQSTSLGFFVAGMGLLAGVFLGRRVPAHNRRKRA